MISKDFYGVSNHKSDAVYFFLLARKNAASKPICQKISLRHRILVLYNFSKCLIFKNLVQNEGENAGK